MRRLMIVLLCVLLAGCAYGDSETVGGRIVLWHSNDDITGSVLDELTDRFMEINPDIRVSVVAVPEAEMLNRYRNAAELSLGPDLFIGDSTWIMQLADAELIQPITAYEPSMGQYLSAAVENARYQDELYGIPYALSPSALYYNTDLVAGVPDSLTALLSQATDGNGMAMTTQFNHAFWGVRAFGGRLFGEDGRVTLDQGGFASWLAWMTTAQNSTSMFLNNDKATLINLFTSGRVAYYVGTPDDLPVLRAAMGGGANLRVAPLPAGPGGAAGPLLHLDTFMFNSASAARNTRAALSLAQFLTNNENSLRLAREIGHVPANLRVPGIDARTYPIVNGFMTQARTAIPITNSNAMQAVLQNGDRLYRQVLDGVVDPTTAASQFTATINATLGFEDAAPQVVSCSQSGEIRLWHSWEMQDRAALDQIIDLYERQCEGIDVIATQFRNESELVATYRTLTDPRLPLGIVTKPDIVLLSDTWVYELASAALIQPIQGDLLQQFVPMTLNALTYQNSVYGTPISLWLTVLFYNQDLVSDPPRTLDDLITEANEGRAVGIAATFESAFWGISAFGGDLFGPERALIVNRNEGMVAWLDWLLAADNLPGFVINADAEMVREVFSNGDAAYYIGSSRLLHRFEDELGRDTVTITALPAGPVSSASPILRTDALMVNTSVEADRLPLMRDFVAFVTSADNQQFLFSLTDRFPANVNVEIQGESSLVAIQSQMARATVFPNIEQIGPVLLLGDVVYASVLAGEVTPTNAVMNFVTTVNEINDVVIPAETPSVEMTIEVTPEVDVTIEQTPPVSAE